MAEPKAYKGKLADFKPDQHNLNRHKQRGRGMVETSQRKRGFGRPGFAAKDKTMLGGNLSILEVAADIELGNGEIFVVETDGDIPIVHVRRDLDPDTEAAKLLAAEDNKSALESIDFDPEMFAAEIAAGIDFGGIFTADEQAAMLAGLNDEPPEDTGPQIDKAEELRQKWGVNQGSIWQLGRHKIACIDSLDEKAVKELIGEDQVKMVWADPPYGINIVAANVSVGGGEAYNIPFGGIKNRTSEGLGSSYGAKPFGSKKVRGSDGAANLIDVGKYYPVEGDSTTETACKGAVLFLNLFPEACQLWWGGNYYTNVLAPSPCWIIWDKDNTGNFADCEMAWTNQPTAARIFEHRWNGMLKASEHGQRRVHPTQKPIALARWCFEKYGHPGDTIFDPFLGSGISVIAAEQMNDNRRVIGCEIMPEYIAIIIQRWVDVTGGDPVCVLSFQ